ncbi:MAG: hypothetical protein ACJATL_000589 [Rickettsiales bacterium]|jgi:hypothetical protein
MQIKVDGVESKNAEIDLVDGKEQKVEVNI